MILVADPNPIRAHTLSTAVRSALDIMHVTTPVATSTTGLHTIQMAQLHAPTIRVVAINLQPTLHQLLSSQLIITALRALLPQRVIIPITDEPEVADFCARIGCHPAFPVATPLATVAAATGVASRKLAVPLNVSSPYIQAMLTQAACTIRAAHSMRDVAGAMRAVMKRQPNRLLATSVADLEALM